MRRVLICWMVCFIIGLGGAAQAQFRPGDTFDPDLLTRDEVRYLQAALVLESSYRGRLDGSWGRGSQAALDAYAEVVGHSGPARVSDVRRLLLRFRREVQSAGWVVQSVPGRRMSHVLPGGLLVEDRQIAVGALTSAKGDLVVRSFELDEARSQSIHTRLAGSHIGGDAPVQVRRTNVWATGVETIDGTQAYLRSDRGGDGTIVARYVQSVAPMTARAALIISSLNRGPQAGLEVPRGGYIDALMNDWERRQAPPPVVAPPAGGPLAVGPRIGTGFFVNNTDIVTSNAALDRCAQPVLRSGAPLAVVAKGGPANLAVLQSPERRSAWFIFGTSSNMPREALVSSFSSRDHATQDVRKAAFQGLPRYLRREDQAGLRGTFGRHMRGAPLLGDRGTVIALVMGEASSRVNVGGFRLDVGDITYVAKTGAIRAFLAGAGVMHQTDARFTPEGDALTAEALQARTAALFCGQ